MKNRIIFGMLMLILVVAVLFLSQYVVSVAYDVFILLLMLIAAYEMTKAIGNKYKKPMFSILVILILVGYAAFKVVHTFNKNVSGDGYGGITSFFIVLVLMFVACFIVNMASSQHSFENVISTFVCMIYPIGIMVYLIGLNYFPGASEPLMFTDWTYDPYSTGTFMPNLKAIAILVTLAAASLTDVFALLFGMMIGGPKLAPHISPKKTIAGAIGGLFGGIAAAAVVFGLSYTGVFGLTGLHEDTVISLVMYLSLGFLVAIATEIGDLMASYIKRFCEIKDYGTLIPGHGGVLDRIDGLIIAAMVTYLYINIVAYCYM